MYLHIFEAAWQRAAGTDKNDKDFEDYLRNTIVRGLM